MRLVKITDSPFCSYLSLANIPNLGLIKKKSSTLVFTFSINRIPLLINRTPRYMVTTKKPTPRGRLHHILYALKNLKVKEWYPPVSIPSSGTPDHLHPVPR